MGEKLDKEVEKIAGHGERILTKIDEEMYLLSKSTGNLAKKEQSQKNLAIYVITEMLHGFEKQEEKEAILKILGITIKGKV